MSELIDRQAAIDMIEKYFDGLPIAVHHDMLAMIHRLPSVKSEPLTLRVNHELTKEEYDKLMQDIKDAPIVLMPSVQQDRKPGEWLHDLLQDAIDDGIITETQASRLMDRIAEDNT